MNKRIIAVLLGFCLLFTGCNSQETEPSVEVSDVTTVSETETSETTEGKGHYVYDPYKTNSMLDAVMGEGNKEVYYKFLKAVEEGKDNFDCDDEELCYWGISEYSMACNPVLSEYIEVPDNPVYDGKAHFKYKIPYEELKVKIEEFKLIVEDILNTTLRDDFTDTEKALALYKYFSDNYEYDYDTYNKMAEDNLTYLNTYRLFIEKKGICMEVSSAYSFLLIQSGVDASTMSGGGHQWSFVNIDGNYYHIDPTFLLESKDYLGYFMMTDEEREKSVNTNIDSFIIASSYAQIHDHPTYHATDNRFNPLWNCYLSEMDRTNKTIIGITVESSEKDTNEFVSVAYN